ncbi:MAG: hypothetical protein MUE94_07510 [Verrucomicrobia bacterium]|nr:hypothetical protein [Verrucomicrobiota bacterium]
MNLPPAEPGAMPWDAASRRNFILLLAGASVFSFGWAMPGVTRVPYVNWLGMSNQTYGLLGSAWALCLIGNFLAPWLSRRFPRKKWLQFLVAMPYLGADLLLGLCVVVALWTHSFAWLLPATIGLLIFWPLAAGWTLGPQSEYIANCIPKSHIGRFISLQQSMAGLLGLAGAGAITWVISAVGVPARYAVAFLAAYALALSGTVLSLFARETPAPSPPVEPFWKPALHAVRTHPRFRSLLGAALVLWMAALLPSQFIQLLGIREWGCPDWVASAAATVQSLAMLCGAALAGFLGQRFGYPRAILACFAALPLGLVLAAWPVSAAFRADTFTGAYTASSGQFAATSGEGETADRSGDSFCVLSLEGGRSLVIRFNRKVDASTFNVNDVVVQDSTGRRLAVTRVAPAEGDARDWIVSLPSEAQRDGRYRLSVQPYVYDEAGRMLDQDGNGHSPREAWRVIGLAACWGLAFSGLGVGLETLMYHLSPPERRAGHFSAFRLVQFSAPSVAFPLSGLLFKTGHFAAAFQALLVCAVLAWLLGRRLLKPLGNTD